MNSTSENVKNVKSKYFKEPLERQWFRKAAFAYMFALYVLPQYFGIPNPFFDLTAVRFTIIVAAIFIITDSDRVEGFKKVLVTEKMGLILLPYLFVLLYTMVLRADLYAFLNPFIEFLELYLLIYVIKDTFGVKQAAKIFIGFIYLLTILGVLESITSVSPFSYLVTIKGIYTGRYMRGGHYRIMSNASHSLGYGLMLITALPFAAYDYEKEELNIFRRPVLLGLLIFNVFMTGSRSSLGVMFGELVALFLLSDIKYLKNNALSLSVVLVLFLFLTFVLQKTAFGSYVLLQVTSLVDSLFGTTYSVKYGANFLQLQQSKAYRKLLKRVFAVDWLNPILGIGRKRGFKSLVDGKKVASIDNFYIAEFVRYAYPGMFSYILFLVYMGLRMVYDIYKTHSAIIRMCFIGTAFYCLHLYIADSLQTFKYLYVLFAFYLCADKKEYVPAKDPCKYIKRGIIEYAKL